MKATFRIGLRVKTANPQEGATLIDACERVRFHLEKVLQDNCGQDNASVNVKPRDGVEVFEAECSGDIGEDELRRLILNYVEREGLEDHMIGGIWVQLDT